MIDIHSHILSGFDDGADSMKDSIAMAKAAVEDGISAVFATPHHADGKYHNEALAVNKAVEELNLQLQEQQIPLMVWPGQEIRVYKNLINDLDRGVTISLNQSRYILIEFPSDRIPSGIEEYIHELKVIGKIAILAHPERNREIIQHPEKLYDLINLGVLSQITAGSVTGSFGKKIQSYALKLCEANMVHFISSDAHNTSNRPFGLSAAYQTIAKQLGKSYVEYYQANARDIVDNNLIGIRQPTHLKHSFFQKYFGRF
jgi:protein-tyrosine phosphatase